MTDGVFICEIWRLCFFSCIRRFVSMKTNINTNKDLRKSNKFHNFWLIVIKLSISFVCTPSNAMEYNIFFARSIRSLVLYSLLVRVFEGVYRCRMQTVRPIHLPAHKNMVVRLSYSRRLPVCDAFCLSIPVRSHTQTIDLQSVSIHWSNHLARPLYSKPWSFAVDS